MLFVLFFLANVGHYLFEKIRLPGMMGEIIFGILAANIVIAGLGDWNLLDRIGIVIETPTSAGSAGYETLMLFSELGVIFLLFTVGLETQVGDLFRVGKPAVFSALLGIAVPFSLGLVFMAVMDEGLMSSLFISTALITTSAGVAAYVLKSLRMTNTPEGQIIVGAAVISEIVTLTVLAVLSGVAAGDTSPLGIAFTVFKSLAFVVLALYVCFRVMPKINAHIDSRRRDDHTDWTMLFAGIGVCFAMAIAAGKMGLSVIVGAYFAGMMFAEYAEEWNLIKEIESVKEFFMTFFFISVGIRVVLADLASADVLILAAGMSAIAIAGKHLARRRRKARRQVSGPGFNGYNRMGNGSQSRSRHGHSGHGSGLRRHRRSRVLLRGHNGNRRNYGFPFHGQEKRHKEVRRKRCSEQNVSLR